MKTSQFTLYSANDPGGPGPLYGFSGSLISILDACLVNGYPGKPAAGWSQPLGPASASVYAAYRPASGSRMTLFVNDNNPNATAAGREAWATGWESGSSLCPAVAVTSNVGGGWGQFPTPAQLLLGNVVWRKSYTADASTQRFWMIYADASTMYLIIQPGDVNYMLGNYFTYMFGDIYSLKSSPDLYRCLIVGRNTLNREGMYIGGSSGMHDFWDLQYIQSTITPNAATGIAPMQIMAGGNYMARSWGGGGSSVQIGKTGDTSKVYVQYISNGSGPMSWFTYGAGSACPAPNAPDNAYYLSPIVVFEPNGNIRGRLRGIYQVCHPVRSFSDGQTFAGSGDYAGKTFQIVKQTSAGGYYAVEISPTVETND